MDENAFPSLILVIGVTDVNNNQASLDYLAVLFGRGDYRGNMRCGKPGESRRLSKLDILHTRGLPHFVARPQL